MWTYKSYIDGKTLEQKEGDSYCFHYGNFIYKNTHEAMEVIGNIYENKELQRWSDEKKIESKGK